MKNVIIILTFVSISLTNLQAQTSALNKIENFCKLKKNLKTPNLELYLKYETCIFIIEDLGVELFYLDNKSIITIENNNIKYYFYDKELYMVKKKEVILYNIAEEEIVPPKINKKLNKILEYINKIL